MSGFSPFAADERHFSTLNTDGGPSSRRLTSTRSNADEKYGFSTPGVDKKHFSTLNADKKSKGFLAQGPTLVRKNPFDRGRTKRVEGVQVPTAPRPLPLRGCMEKVGLSLSLVPTAPRPPSLQRQTGRTRSPSSRPLTLTGTYVDEKHFLTLNADEKPASAGEKSRSTDRSEERLYQMGAGYSSTAKVGLSSSSGLRTVVKSAMRKEENLQRF
jgi:hypothetical protein